MFFSTHKFGLIFYDIFADFVDVWSNEEGTSPIYTVSHFGTGLVSALKLWENNCSVFTAVACGSTLQVHVVEHSYGHLKEHMDFELNVSCKMLPEFQIL